ncbi:MAG: UDP-3-O-acyl-N-acetylglucosamine deacetylase [Candidatus Aceula meridiana]|nr:UDP-3-O-acyl-N-acetylglucosamine deacetylase [Candidatus Aceula meridiana]
MREKQQTIKKETSVEGVGLHTGKKVKVVFKPAVADAGICFIRTDLKDSPSVCADLAHILDKTALPRCTSIGAGEAVVHTVEHLMAALYGLQIDNLIIEISGEEMPGLDGSGLIFYEAIKKSGVVEQQADRQYLEVKEPIWLEENGATLFAVPADHLMVSYTLDYAHPTLNAQFFSGKINADIFEKEIVSSRTFCLESEAKKLQENGLGKGANYQNTLVVTEDGVKDNKVRFPDEFVRHKVLDFIGDLYLLGKPLKAHVVCIRSGHSLNRKLLQRIVEQEKKHTQRFEPKEYQHLEGQALDTEQIKEILPHRYPFLFVDRVLDLEPGKRAVAIKNVTSNEYFFKGHFPQRPVMPGVIMVEAMAQVAGIVLLAAPENKGKLALFMAIDNVKFRRVVEPGDQLVMELTVTKIKSRAAEVHGEAKVDGKLVTEVDLTLSFTDADFLKT